MLLGAPLLNRCGILAEVLICLSLSFLVCQMRRTFSALSAAAVISSSLRSLYTFHGMELNAVGISSK